MVDDAETGTETAAVAQMPTGRSHDDATARPASDEDEADDISAPLEPGPDVEDDSAEPEGVVDPLDEDDPDDEDDEEDDVFVGLGEDEADDETADLEEGPGEQEIEELDRRGLGAEPDDGTIADQRQDVERGSIG